jgi:glycosyltransferase involved in cell wall biosynthesis
MACGLPVIASSTSSIPEVVGQAGIMVDPYDAEALAASMATLLKDPERQNELAKAGLERAKRFSWERAARETMAVYKNLVG